jgi:hypothetical protein
VIIREHIKLWKNPVILAVVLIGFLTNAFILIRGENTRNLYLDTSVKMYNECYQKIQHMSSEKAKKYVNQKIEQGENNEKIGYAELIAWKLVKKEIATTGIYDTYFNARKQEVNNRSSFAIFDRGDDYANRSAEQTIHVLHKFIGRKIKVAPSRGVRMVMNTLSTDLIGIMLLFFLCTVAFMREKEKGVFPFVRTCINGRGRYMICKMISMLLYTIELVILLYAENFCIAKVLYGLGDTTRYIQSVYGYIGTGFNGSVKKAMIVFLCYKILSYFLLLLGIILIMVLCEKARSVYIVCCLWLGTSMVIYLQISENSAVSIFKNINIFAYMDVGRMMENYRIINLFGVLVPYVAVYLFTVITGSVMIGVMAALFFEEQKISSKANRIFGGLRERRTKEQNKTKKLNWISNALWLQEGKKIIWYQRVWMLLIVGLLIAVYTYSPVTSIYSDENDIYYKEYMDILSGPYTIEKDQKITEWEKQMESLRMKQEDALSKANSESESELILKKYESKLRPQKALSMIRGQAKYLKTIKNGSFYYPRGYERLTGGESAGYDDAIYALLGAVMLILCLTGIYSYETESGMERILYTTPKGKTSLGKIKTMWGLIITTFLFVLIYAPWYYSILSAFGTNGMNSSVISMQHISLHFQSFSVLQYLIFITLLRYVGFLMVMGIVFILSKIMKSYMMTMVVAAALVLLPLILYISGIDAFHNVLLNPVLLGNGL